VIWIRCPVVVLQVAGNASRDRDVVVVVDVAIRTLPRRHGVHSRQREASERVVEGCVVPAIKTMALAAVRRELAADVVRVDRILEFAGVAAVAIRWHRGVFAERAILMAGRTVHGGMGSD